MDVSTCAMRPCQHTTSTIKRPLKSAMCSASSFCGRCSVSPPWASSPLDSHCSACSSTPTAAADPHASSREGAAVLGSSRGATSRSGRDDDSMLANGPRHAREACGGTWCTEFMQR